MKRLHAEIQTRAIGIALVLITGTSWLLLSLSAAAQPWITTNTIG
jgi:hypothetical protein